MDIPFDLLKIVSSFLIIPKMKLLDWIDIGSLVNYKLSGNPNAINFLKKHPEKIDWHCLSYNLNASAINLLEKLPDDAKIKIEDMHPLGIGSPDDVANAVVFLLSDLSKWITGTSMIVDGGYSSL